MSADRLLMHQSLAQEIVAFLDHFIIAHSLPRTIEVISQSVAIWVLVTRDLWGFYWFKKIYEYFNGGNCLPLLEEHNNRIFQNKAECICRWQISTMHHFL